MSRQRSFYMVFAEENTVPLAMFQEEQWAKDWAWQYCRTAKINVFDLKFANVGDLVKRLEEGPRGD